MPVQSLVWLVSLLLFLSGIFIVAFAIMNNMETSEQGSYNQAGDVDVCVWRVAVKPDVFLWVKTKVIQYSPYTRSACVSGSGVILPVTCQWIVRPIFETIIFRWINYRVHVCMTANIKSPMFCYTVQWKHKFTVVHDDHSCAYNRRTESSSLTEQQVLHGVALNIVLENRWKKCSLSLLTSLASFVCSYHHVRSGNKKAELDSCVLMLSQMSCDLCESVSHDILFSIQKQMNPGQYQEEHPFDCSIIY